MHWIGLIGLPFLAALIGWGTNRLAIVLLFHPKNEKNILGFKFQGVFPKRQNLIAVRIADLIANNLMTSNDLKTKLFTAENMQDLRSLIEGKIGNYLEKEFKEDYPLISIVVGKKSKTKIKAAVLKKFDGTVEEVHNQFDELLNERVDIHSIVRTKVESLDSDEIGDMMNKIMSKELQFIEWTGAIIGFLVGCLQVGLTLLLT